MHTQSDTPLRPAATVKDGAAGTAGVNAGGVSGAGAGGVSGAAGADPSPSAASSASSPAVSPAPAAESAPAADSAPAASPGDAGSPSPGDAAKDEQVSAIIAEFSEIFAFARSRWASYASELHADLKGAGMMVLQLVLRKGPVTATGISQMLDMDKALVSRQIAKLRDLGFVSAEPAPEDRRVVLLTASPQAHELMDHLRQRWAHAYHERFTDWSIDELSHLRDGLHRFNASANEVHVVGPAGRCGRERRAAE